MIYYTFTYFLLSVRANSLKILLGICTCKATFHVNVVKQSRCEDARSVEVDPVEVIRDSKLRLDPCKRDDRERRSWISWRVLWLAIRRVHDISSSSNELVEAPITKSRTLLTNRRRDLCKFINRKPRASTGSN